MARFARVGRAGRSCHYVCLVTCRALQSAAECPTVPIKQNLAQTYAQIDVKRKIFLAIALGAGGWLAITGLSTEAADSTHSHGLSAGAKAPGFILKDKDGKEHALAEFQKKAKFVALVFYRSADW